MAELAIAGQYKAFDYTGGAQSIQLLPGTYKLEVWGAQGGVGYSNSAGGKGGYSSGVIVLSRPTTFYVYVGGNPGSTVAGGFNGGGSGNQNRNDNGGGGGGTDMRIGSTSLYARVIVAGGGGGGVSFFVNSDESEINMANYESIELEYHPIGEKNSKIIVKLK